MIVQMIQSLENKMELQINGLKTRIEKMQEMFNKDLEEIKKSQSIMNNALNEIFAGYSNLGCRFFSFITLSICCHSLLA